MSGAEEPAALAVEDLRIDVGRTGHDIVDRVSFTIARGEILGLVGESGSGKTTTGLAILGHQRRGARIVHGRIRVGDRDMLALSRASRRDARGRLVAYVPQDPSAALNPALRIGSQLLEALRVHDVGDGSRARRDRIAEVMGEVLLPQEPSFLRRFPHELSGGQQQRVGIAMAFACRPAVVVLDEPTTGLDVTTQAHVLETIRSVTRQQGAAALYVTHDLAVVASLADRVAVMYAGRLVEEGPTEELFRSAGHPYTRRLIAAIPRLESARTLVGIPGRAPSPGTRPGGCPFSPRCPVALPECEAGLPDPVALGERHSARCLRAVEVRAGLGTGAGGGRAPAAEEEGRDAVVVQGVDASYGPTRVVHGVNLRVSGGECLALVGESGSGKTTLARAIAGLHGDWTGEISLLGSPLARTVAARSRGERRRIQYVFQNPYGSLNPRRTVAQSVGRPLALLDLTGAEASRRVDEMLERVSLSTLYADRYPDELSGGERQRVAIARALICEPDVLICDEVTSALDVSVQAAIVNLLVALQRDLGLAMLFVTHNLPLVRSIAQRVAVMRNGEIVEEGTVAAVLGAPTDAYTQRLLADAPGVGSLAAVTADGADAERPEGT